MSQSNGARESPTKGSFHNSPGRSSSYAESCMTYDSDWTSELSDSVGHSRDHDVFSNSFQRSVANLPGPKEPTVKAAEYVQGLPSQEDRLENLETLGQRRRRVWSESCGSKRRGESRNWSSDGTGFSSVESVSSAFSLQDSGSSSNWVDSWENNVFDTTVVPEADQTIVGTPDGKNLEEDFITNNTLSKQSTISEDPNQEGLTRTLTEESLKESLKDENHLSRTLSNSDILDLASSITTAVSRKRESFIKSQSWNESCESELSIKSVTSVDELLDVWNDPEEFLLNLGFGLSTADPLERIPQRFLSQESEAAGISVEKFQQDVRDRERGYNFCLTGGLRGLERFLTMQLKNSGLQFSPFASPTHSPHSERLPSFAEPGRHHGLGIGHNGDHTVVHPVPFNPSYEQSRSEPYSRSRFSSRRSSNDSYISTEDSFSGSEVAYDSDLSSSGDWSDSREESRRTKGKGKRLQLTTSNLDTVEEELESQLRAKSPCPLPRSPNPLTPETAFEKVDTDASPSTEDTVVEEKVAKSASSMENSSPHRPEVIRAINLERLKTAQDSFEIEEISISDVQTDDSVPCARNGLDRKDSLTRNESQQSDSSGFADELTESISPASPQHERALEELGEDLPSKSEETVESLEQNNNLKARDLSDKLSDIPHDHRTSENENNLLRVHKDIEEEDDARPHTRPRSGTFPSINAISSGPEGPKSVVEVLETLEKNYRKAEKEVQRREAGEGVQKRRRLFSKMDTVDLDNYSFNHGKSTHSKSETGEFKGALGDKSAMEGAIEEANLELSEQTCCAANSDELLERLESEDLCATLDEDKNTVSSQKVRADQLVDRSLGLDSASDGLEDKSQAIEAQRELQDLKLMQRALFKYKQDLWELEEWSTQMYNEEGDGVTTQQVRKELDSLGNLRKNVKREVEKMETVIESQMKEVISHRGSMDNLSERFAHWSLNHIDVLNKMVTLMKEQDSLRQHLQDIKTKEKEITGLEAPSSPLSKNIYKTLNKSELVTELVNTQLELARLRVMARTEMTAAIAEMKKCILSDIKREVDHELRLMQWQIKDRDEQIAQLKTLLQQSGQQFSSSNKGDKSTKEKSSEEEVIKTKEIGGTKEGSRPQKIDAGEELLKDKSPSPEEIIKEVDANI